MSKAKYLKSFLKVVAPKNELELAEQIKKEKLELTHASLEFWRGSTKKTHTWRQQRRKVALLETLVNQKKYLRGLGPESGEAEGRGRGRLSSKIMDKL